MFLLKKYPIKHYKKNLSRIIKGQTIFLYRSNIALMGSDYLSQDKSNGNISSKFNRYKLVLFAFVIAFVIVFSVIFSVFLLMSF